MIKCNSRFGFGKCVASMDTDGILECDFAEACNYDEEVILKECDCAEPYKEGET